MSTTQDAPAVSEQLRPIENDIISLFTLVRQLENWVKEQSTAIADLQSAVVKLAGSGAEPAPAIEALIAEIEAGGWDWSINGYTVSGDRYAHIYDADNAKFIAASQPHDSVVAALQEALDRARQAVRS